MVKPYVLIAALVVAGCAREGAAPSAPTAAPAIPAALTAAATLTPTATGVAPSSAPMDRTPLQIKNATSFSGDGPLAVKGFALDASGNALLGGSLRGHMRWGAAEIASQSEQQPDGFLGVLDPNFSPTRANLISGSSPVSLAQVVGKDLHIGVGRFVGAVEVGGKKLAGKGSYDAVVAAFETGGSVRFARAFGSKQYSDALLVAVDEHGNSVVGGAFQGLLQLDQFPLQADGGFPNAFVTKLDRDGHVLWAKGFSGRRNTDLRVIAVDASGDVVIAGEFHAGFQDSSLKLRDKELGSVSYVLKLAPDGAVRWVVPFHGEKPTRAGGLTTLDDGIAVTVNFEHGLDKPVAVPSSESGTAVFKISKDGEIRWVKTIGAADSAAIAVSPGGGLVVAGSFYQRLSFGAKTLASTGRFDAFVATMSPDGEPVSLKGFGVRDQSTSCTAVAVRPSGAIVAMGRFSGEIDLGKGLMSAGKNDGTFLVELQP